MDFDQIKELILLVNATELTDLELEAGSVRLRIRKGRVENSPLLPPQPQVRLEEIRAPMVGTFYRAPAPDAPPYVQEGDIVLPGQVLCVIEAMKLMNEIEAEFRGVVRQVLVENGQPVEYGQVLMLLERLD